MTSPSTVLLRIQSDDRLVALARAGHDRAFEAIVERYQRQLLRACRRILPEARAEDALQQALVSAWTALRRGDEISDLRPWLYRIARNTALNHLRMAGYDFDTLVDTLSATHDPEEEVLRRAVVRQTLAAVAALPERQRDALLRTAVQGRGQDEVARDLGLTDTAVRQLVHRARVAVRTAATAVVPMPAAIWLASAGARAEPMAGRIAELVTAGGTAGATVTLAKAGTVVVLTGGAFATPAVVPDRPAELRTAHERPAASASAREAAMVAAPRRGAAPSATATAPPARAATPASTATPAVRERATREAERRGKSERRRAGGDRGGEPIDDNDGDRGGEPIDDNDGDRGGEPVDDDDDGDRSGHSEHDDDLDDAPVTPPAAPPSADNEESSSGSGPGDDSGDDLRHGKSESGGDHEPEPEHD